MLYGNPICSHNLECAHIHSRRHQFLRHDPLNAVSLCGAHHRWYTDHPTEFTAWLKRHIGHGALDILMEKLRVQHKWLKGMKKEARLHYREELKKMQEARDRGNIKKLDFIGFF